MFRGKQPVPLDLHRVNLLEQQFQAIEFTVKLSLQMRWQGTAITRLEFF